MSKKILSIETSSSNCSVCLSIDGVNSAIYSLNGKNFHDKFLAELTRRLLDDFELKVDDLNAVAVSIGPGSFTGLRIGVSFAKGLCFNNQPKLIPVPTLSALAFYGKQFLQKFNYKNIIPLIFSHKDLFYYQIFDGNCDSNSEIFMKSIEEIQKFIEDDTLVISNGVIGGFEQFVIKQLDAEIISNYANILYENAIFSDAGEITPMYVQEFIPKNH